MSTSTGYPIKRAGRYALLTGAVSFVLSPVQVQAADDTITEVVVTGSRIPQPNLQSISPVTAVSNEEIKQQGTTRVEDLLNNLPQVTADLGANVSNGSPGTASVNLRNLGAQRTQVLINGRRLMPGDPTQNGNALPDLNQIPAALVDRVEVLTGGASAVYGADAVAGVVNFIMNDHFEGVRVDMNYSFYQHNQGNDAIADLVAGRDFALPKSNVRDGYSRDITAILGGNFADGQGNITVYGGYRKQDSISQAKRDFSACALNSGDTFACGGSSTTFPGRFTTADDDVTIGPGNVAVPYDSALHAFNFAPTNFYQRPDERYTAGLFGHYEFNDHATAYTEFMFMDDRTIAQIAPSGMFYGSGLGTSGGVPDGSWVVNCDNPYLMASGLGTVVCGSALGTATNTNVQIGRRNIEGGPRQDDLGHTSFRSVFGVRGNIAGPWEYDAYFTNGITRLSENFQNDVSIARLSNALLAVNSVDADGNPVVICQANVGGANGAPGCVPYNIFQLGGSTPAALAYFQTPGFQQGKTTERIANFSVTGNLGEYGMHTPWAKDGLGVAMGTEYRDEKTELKVDQEYYTGDLAGQGAPVLPMSGQFHVWEAFVEARMPLIQDVPFAEALSVEAGYRYSDYSLGFTTDTYKLGVDWAPVRDVRLRASYQRAVRAPNLQELYLPPKVQLDGSTDPCAGAVEDLGFTAEQCAFSGVTAAEYGNIIESNSGQYNGLVGGNPTLKPETSDTISFGLVFTPTFAEGLSITLDYFDIKVTDVIDLPSYGADFIVNQCVTTGNPFYCDKVHRVPETGGPADGSLWIGTSGYIEDGTFNLGELRTKGIDLTANYGVDIGSAGRLAFNFNGTYTDTFEKEPVPGLGSYDCAGLYGSVCGVPQPDWRHSVRVSWMTPWAGVDLSLNWRHVNEVKVDTTSSNPLLAGEVIATDKKLGSREYFDVTGAYTFAEQYTFRIGINNVLDKDPPLNGDASTGNLAYNNGNTWPQVYDVLGRYVFMNVTADF